MDRFKLILRVIASVLVVCLVVVSAFGLDIKSLYNRAALMALAFAAPEGISCLFESDDTTPPKTDVAIKPPSEVVQGVIPEAEANGLQSVSCPIEQKVMGHIVKKTLTPYNAKAHSNGVYISNTSGADIDIAADLASELKFKVEKSSEPQILIYHTHATEGFMTDESEYYTDFDEPRSTDTEVNIVKIGEVIAQRLTDAGYSVIHDKTLHDHPGYSGSYSRSAETVKKNLLKYPSIKIAIDVHRDSISSGKSDKVAPVVMVNGKEAAQVMLVMGSETGSIENHPDWRQNLKLATKLQYVFESSYPQFARAMLLRSAKYNQNLTTGSILIEVGSDANTLEQAMYSAELVGDSLTVLLNSQ